MTPSASFRPEAAVEKSDSVFRIPESYKYISSDPIDLIGLLKQAHHPKAGAIVLFSGETRDLSHGNAVDYLEYEAQEVLAANMIDAVLKEAVEKWQLNFAVAQHRIGRVGVCECAVVVITASPHRREAYAANKFIIDKIKHEAPIWKCEYFADGSSEWGGNCDCHKTTGDLSKHIYEV